MCNWIGFLLVSAVRSAFKLWLLGRFMAIYCCSAWIGDGKSFARIKQMEQILLQSFSNIHISIHYVGTLVLLYIVCAWCTLCSLERLLKLLSLVETDQRNKKVTNEGIRQLYNVECCLFFDKWYFSIWIMELF